MAEPGKESAAAPPPPPQETVPQAPAAVAEPRLQPISASHDTETAAGGAAALDSAQPKAESAPQPPQKQTTTEADGQPPVATMPQKVAALPPPPETPAQESAAPAVPTPPPPPQEPVAMAAVGAPDQTTREADGQPPVATMPQKVAALPSPAETPAQESALPAAPTPPPPQKQESGVPKLASSVHEEKDAAKAREEEGEKKSARRRWRSLSAAVCLLFLRPKSEETKLATPHGDKQPASGLEAEKKPTAGEMPLPQKDSGSAPHVPSKTEAGKGEGETKAAALDGKPPEPGQEQVATLPSAQEQSGKKQPASGQEGQKPTEKKKTSRKLSDGAARKTTPPQLQGEHSSASLKKFRKVGRVVQFVVDLTKKKKKQPETASSGPGGQEGSEAKPEEKEPPVTVPEKKEEKKTPKQHRNWPREEVRLEGILEEAFTRLVAAEYVKELRGVRQKCLLTFSVFDLASEVKKQAMIYWWVAEFKLLHRRSDPQAPGGARAPAAGGGGKGADGTGSSRDDDDDNAEGIFGMLSDQGFLVPMKNWCSKVIHGCQVNPLVHWMLKRQARGDRFAELDDKGSPADLQLNSGILCLTSGNRPMLQKLRMKDEAQPQPQGRKKDESRPQSQAGRRSKKITKEPSMPGKSNNVQDDQQQPATTKDEAQVGSKSMAAADKAPSQKDQDRPTQAKDQLITKDQRQPTTEDGAQVGSKSMATIGKTSSQKVPSRKDEDPAQAKDQLTNDQQQSTLKDEAQVGSKSSTTSDKAPSQKDEDPTQTKDKLTKDQQQQTVKDKAQIGSKPMVASDKAPSQKDKDLTQDKDQLTKGAQNIKPISKPENVDEIHPQLFEGKRVILNVNAHVYPISRSAFLRLAECLVVLQLGRWNNLDDKTYMEVDGLDSQNAIGLLKNLRYLGLRGLSRLTELPKGIESLKKLVILDMRGCQNLVKVEAGDNFITQFPTKKSAITQLKQLTHLDLTECYMLEHIGRGITSLTELQVFKGFVFATGTQENKACWKNKACRIQDLKKLKKLQKLTISITTDANVAEGEMADLKNLTGLQKLTITWSEIPSILEGDTKKVKDKRHELVERWTSFQLPKDLMKLDIRCYPKEELKLGGHDKLKKLYLRGGDMKKFSTEKPNTIQTLRLRYLKKFEMKWKDIRSELQDIEYVEIVVINKDAIREKDKSDELMKVAKDEEEKLIEQMKIPCFTLDGYGVWTKDQKEEDNKKILDAMRNNKAFGPSEDDSKPQVVNKDGDKAATKEQEVVKEE